MHRSMVPAASPASVSRRSLTRVEPVSRAQVRPSRAIRGDSVSKCCRASISVGAIRADCHPLWAANQMQAAATMVLPLPTSP